MTYKALDSLPNRFSFSKDHLGFNNGKENLTLLPKNTLPLVEDHFGFDSDNFVITMLGENGVDVENIDPQSIQVFKDKMNFKKFRKFS